MAKVLIIEDEPGTALALEVILSENGFSIATAGDGLTGLQRLEENPPDVVLVDLRLPGISGRQVIETMHARANDNCPKVIIMSGSIEGCDDFPSREFYDGFVSKPFDLDEVLDLVHLFATTSEAVV